jgi:hypothetical protein
MMLCLLSDVKILLGITLADTSQDALLNTLISRISNRVARAMGYPIQRATYVGERYSVNNQQKLYLKAFPIQSVSLVTIAGRAVPSTDYEIMPDGSLYLGSGWCGNYWTKTMTYDPVSGVREILISYIGGWFLPLDTGYVAGQADSLPEIISEAVAENAVMDYRKTAAETEGLKSHSEGGISDTWFDKSENSFGLSSGVLAAIEPYMFKFGVA